MRVRLQHIFIFVSVLIGICKLTAVEKNNSTQKEPQIEEEIDVKKLSESFGNFIGKNLETSGIKLDIESIIKGIREGASGKPAPMTEQEYADAMTTIQKKVLERQAEQNLKEAKEFLTKNEKLEGITTIEEGKLQFKILQKGEGLTVEKGNTPRLEYSGRYLNGTEFGNSKSAGGPIAVPLDQTIPGFSKGIIGMQKGEKRRLFIHPDLAYGTSGHLQPNALLVFDVEIIDTNVKEHELDDDDEDLDDEDDEDDHDIDDNDEDEEEDLRYFDSNKLKKFQ